MAFNMYAGAPVGGNAYAYPGMANAFAPPGYAWEYYAEAYAPYAAYAANMMQAYQMPIGAFQQAGYPQFGMYPDFSGYEYVFPTAHCIIHVFRSASPPWQPLQGNDMLRQEKKIVPCNITVEELMQQLGCAGGPNSRIVELVAASNNRWHKGIEINGAEEDKIKKKIDEFGWNADRDGQVNENGELKGDPVCIWVSG